MLLCNKTTTCSLGKLQIRHLFVSSYPLKCLHILGLEKCFLCLAFDMCILQGIPCASRIADDEIITLYYRHYSQWWHPELNVIC